ncbi:MAG: hypothetical protein LM587_02535 [Candidatus Aenigmarchaeota archaeon]|jgi:uncharacterized membrane protein YidH (DUF202 family)|nr:hypothetical protein [Candidatus Aenigmarchaeota archaeon]
MLRRTTKKIKEKSIKLLSIAIILIGILVLFMNAIVWQSIDTFDLAKRINLLSFLLGFLYLLFGVVLLKAKF